MERLGHMIQDDVGSGSWAPFRFIRNGTPLSHLFFADDLILYAKVDLSQAEIINSILVEFGKFSGHRVSCRKSSIYVSPNIEDGIQHAISNRMGFQQIWKRRNDVVFHNPSLSDSALISRSLAWAKHYFDSAVLNTTSPSVSSCGRPRSCIVSKDYPGQDLGIATEYSSTIRGGHVPASEASICGGSQAGRR
ncbi:hypothetical protein V6N13_120714 [Hibiscus sabdariffa]